jgi:hypothetical protein
LQQSKLLSFDGQMWQRHTDQVLAVSVTARGFEVVDTHFQRAFHSEESVFFSTSALLRRQVAEGDTHRPERKHRDTQIGPAKTTILHPASRLVFPQV